MTTLVLFATAWGSKHGGINVVNMELASALARVLRECGRVVCVVPHADDRERAAAGESGTVLLSLELDPATLPDFFDPLWVESAHAKLVDAGVPAVDWCVGHDAISGGAANAMKKAGHATRSLVISHMSYSDYQGVKHPEYNDIETKIWDQKQILRNADVVTAVGPLLGKRASDAVDRSVPMFVPGLASVKPRPLRNQFEAVSFGRFERTNDRIKQIQLAAEGLADAVRRAGEPGGPRALLDNPTLKLIGVSSDREASSALRRVMLARASQIVNLRSMPYREDRQALYEEIAGSSVALMLSWHEGFGLTGWEAIAADVPLVVSEQSGLYALLREEGLHKLVHGVRVDGNYGDDESPNFSEVDLRRVSTLILEVAEAPDIAKKVARNLRESLEAKRYTWDNAARAVLGALDIAPPESRREAQESPDKAATASATKPTLEDYLARIREVAGQVTLAGADRPRPIQDVYVELELSRAGIDGNPKIEEDEGDEQNAPLETELRRRKTAPWRQITETIPADDLLDFSDHTLIVGAAGTGKSTLLRWLACAAAKRRQADPNARIPIWLSCLPLRSDVEKNLVGSLVSRALASVELETRPSPAATAIGEAIASGHVLLLIDSFDESSAAEQAHAEDWLPKLEGRVVVASRPLLDNAPLGGIKTVTLHGVPGIAAESLLKKYFAGEDWVDGLLQELRSLPDGQAWLETPVLLGLAASLYRSKTVLPRAAIDLYEAAVEHLLNKDSLPPKYRGQTLRPELQRLARNLLLPEFGAPQVIFEMPDVSAIRQEIYKLTGLFEGSSRFRFTHLTLGEYLAAGAEIDLAKERARLVEANRQPLEGSSLEILPMAHALRGTEALDPLLAEARDRDLSDHRLLRLLVRALGYGGKGVDEFCVDHAPELIRLVAMRLDTPSGRFGESELALMDAAERALLAIRGTVDKSEVESAFARLLRLPGGVGTEAHVAAWILRVRQPERRESAWWSTVERQARALVREGIGVEGVVQLTEGADGQNQWRSACYLAKYPALRDRLRPLLYHGQALGRRFMVANLACDEAAEPDWCERLGDEDDIVRESCVAELRQQLRTKAGYLPRLRDMLARDPSERVRAALVDVLASDPLSLRKIREILRTTNAERPIRSGDKLAVRDAAIGALLNDPESEKAVEEYVTQPKEFWASGTKETLARIKAVPRWRLLLLERLRASDVGDREIAAFAQDPDAEPHLRALLDRAEAHVACSAVKALGKRVERSRLLQLIKHPNEELRCAAILALGQQTGTEQYLRPLLRGSRAERIAAAKSLAGDETSAAIVADHLLRYPADDVRLAAVDALAAQSFGSDVLRDYFIETRRLPEHELLPHCEPIFHGLVRSRIVEVLARHDCSTGLMVASLEDPHRRVRVAAARVLVDHPSMAGRLVERFEAGDGDVYDVICAKLTNRPSVREHLLWCLNRDLPELRFAAFRYLVDRAGSRETLKTMLGSAEVREEWRATIVGALMRDPDSMQLVRGCVSDQSEEVRYQAFRLLRHDKTVRERFREQAGDVEWMKATAQKETNPLARPYVSGVLSGDPDAYPILVDYLDSDDSGVLTYVAPMLRGYRQAYPRLADLLVHPSPSVRAAAMRALGDHEPVRDVLVDALAPDPPTCDALDVRTRALRSRDLGELRRAAADALKDVPFLRPRFRSLLNNDDKHVREAAIHAVSADESAEAVKLLRERLTAEPEEDLRAQIVWALRADPGSVGALRDRLHNDYRSDVRQQAARALGTGDLTPAFALREQPFVAGVVRTLQGLLVPGPGAAALGTFLSAPRPVDLDAEPELGEIVVAWLCARLCWAYELGREFEGQVLGELELQVPRMGQPGSLVLIRVAMDPFVLARERRLRPNHNLMVVWEIAKHLTAVDPPSVVLGCADVSFLNLQPPPLEPGEVRFGPTFFGFRVNARRTIT